MTIDVDPQAPGLARTLAGGTHVARIPESATQYRLRLLQLYQWGTFSSLVKIDVAADGFLFTGDSGSGKSTLLDAHAIMLTPPGRVGLNVAAEGGGKDRTLVSYIRGAWGQETAETGEIVTKVLRDKTTWSALAETYETTGGKIVTLVQLFWLRNTSRKASDVQREYLVFERAVDLADFEVFALDDYNRGKLKGWFPDALISDAFSVYEHKFRRLMGIDSTLALRLLHKTQSAKNLGDLNTFLRDFMLDTPKTFDLADDAVAAFRELKAAHAEMVTAREQRDRLRRALTLLTTRVNQLERLADVVRQHGAVSAYREHRRVGLLTVLETTHTAELAEATQRAEEAARRFHVAEAHMADLQEQQRGMDDGGVARLQAAVDTAQETERTTLRHHARLVTATRDFGAGLPADATTLLQVVSDARAYLDAQAAQRAQAESAVFDARQARDAQAVILERAEQELRSLRAQTSNLPGTLLGIRATMAAALQLAESQLPFLGQLLDVRPEESAWHGAIERALGGDSSCLVVLSDDLPQVTRYLRDTNIGGKLICLEATRIVAPAPAPGADTVGSKLLIRAGATSAWLHQRAATHYTHLCTNDTTRYAAAEKAITQSGLLKLGRTRHQKDDRFRVGDASRWVIGFGNAKKIVLFMAQVTTLRASVEALSTEFESARAAADADAARVMAATAIGTMTWDDVNVVQRRATLEALREQLTAATAAHPNLIALRAQIATHQAVIDTTRHASIRAEVAERAITDKLIEIQQDLETARTREQEPLTPDLLAELDLLFATFTVTLKTLEAQASRVGEELQTRRRELETTIARLEGQVEREFALFQSQWPSAAADVDATFASTEGFLAILARLETEDFPRFETRFLALLQQQSTEQLSHLVTDMDTQRLEIPKRLSLVNDSLRTAAFNPGTYLVIETSMRNLPDVRDFRARVKACTEGLFSSAPTSAEDAATRFAALESLVQQLSRDDKAGLTWRALVLDVRQHIEFIAKEIDAITGEIREVYQSGAGKSGGQRQKLAATCLAAALRYQLGGRDRDVPQFATVVLDEAFDKADATFTALAMNIFRQFGFQMVIATPNKSIRTLEPFIGGVCVVTIAERKRSSVQVINIDPVTHRLPTIATVTEATRAVA